MSPRPRPARLPSSVEVSHTERFEVVDVCRSAVNRNFLSFSALTYPLQRAGRVGPARCPGRVLLSQVPFGQPPSLHPLRIRLPGVVRGLLKVLRVCPTSRSVRHRRASLDFPDVPGHIPIPRPDVGSPGSRARCLRCATGSLTARDSGTPRDIGASDGAFHFLLQRRRPGVSSTRLNTRPARSPVNASTLLLRTAPHELGADVGRYFTFV